MRGAIIPLSHTPSWPAQGQLPFTGFKSSSQLAFVFLLFVALYHSTLLSAVRLHPFCYIRYHLSD